MKPETLEALLIDRSLGELTLETEELLLDHLALNPAAARRGDALDATMHWARQSVAVSLERPVRPLAAGRPGKPGEWRRRIRIGLPGVMRLAACVILGLAAGWWIHAAAGRAAGTPATARIALPPDSIQLRSSEHKNPEPTFWSVANFRQQQRPLPASRRDRGDAFRIPWESIVN